MLGEEVEAAVLSKPCGRRCRDHIRGKIFFFLESEEAD
jgi:hypothetical protein